MKKKITTLFLLALGATTYAQVVPGVGIGTPLPAQSAMLEIDSADKGVLIPRVTISDLKTYGLAGGVAVEGMLVFNNTAKVDPADAKKTLINKGFHYWSATTGQWELITSQSQLNSVVNNLKEEIKTEIEKITNIGGGTAGNSSYLVSFKPDKDGEDGTTGTLSYLYPQKDADGKITGYEKKTISFADLVKGEETNTFIRPVVDGKLADGTTDKIVAYVYFSEAAIRKFKADKPTEAIDKITDDYGTKLDISAVVTNNTKNIFNDKETIKEVTKILENAKDVVRAVSDGNGGVKLVYKAIENGPDIDFPINLIETKTKFGRLASDKDLDAIADTDYKPVVDAPKEVKAGEVIYQYYGEDKTTPNFINITADVIKTINENTEVKKAFNKTVNQFLSQGGNVYYGIIKDPVTGVIGDAPILFEKKEQADGSFKDFPIDISKDILKVIENDNKIIEKIKELTTVKVDGGGSKTGEVIDGFHVYKAMLPGTVEEKSAGLGYNSNFKENLKPNNFKRLKSIQILTKNGQLVLNNVTDVTFVDAATGLAFNFGAGKMYTPLKAGAYDVVLEYISTEAYVAPTPQP
ncbi:hypothetical protein [Myroides sp.]|uniref:hypothetical protein n=1 Tax=Myroides sp. TaxID=1874736 RepID=UPI003F36CF2A